MRGFDPAIVPTTPLTLDKGRTGGVCTNTLVETALYTYSLAGGRLGTTNRVRLTAHFLAQDTSADVTGLQIRLKYGGNPMPSVSTGDIHGSGTNTVLKIIFEVGGDNATNNQQSLAHVQCAWAVSPMNSVFRGSSVKDSTVAQNIDVTFQWFAASALKIVTEYGHLLELLQ